MLTAQKLTEIVRNLDAFADDGPPPSLSMIDGTITAAICCPDPIQLSEIIGIIIGQGENKDEFKSKEHEEIFSQAIRELNDSITEDLQASSLTPLATESPYLSDAVDYKAWCLGFLMVYLKFEDRFQKGGDEVENLVNVVYEWADMSNDSSFKKLPAKEKRNVLAEMEEELQNNIVELYWYWQENS